MSMQTDCIYGYGFKVFASDKSLSDFIQKHEAVVKTLDGGREILQFIEDCNLSGRPLDPLKEMFSDYENKTNGDWGLYGIIADIMSEETGIRFEYRQAQEDDEDDAIFLPETMPWQFNEREKGLTEDSLEKICKKYMDELDDRLIFEFIRLEYFG